MNNYLQHTHLIIAPSNSRRAVFWKNVLEQNDLEYIHISYIDIINDNFILDAKVSYTVRLESAGEDFNTYKSIINFENVSPSFKLLKENFGEISNFESWYLSWVQVLHKIKNLENIFQLQFINNPLDIATVFNKKETQLKLLKNNISCPAILEATTYKELTEEMVAKKIPQVFIKPTAGSSASGILAFRYLSADKQIAYTTIKKQQSKFYNSLKIQKLTTTKEIKETFDVISKNPLQIERWIPKWQFKKLSVDFRVVVIDSKVEFIVPRASKHPITNLHLGNQKLKFEDLKLPLKIKIAIQNSALEAMKCFPGLHYAGVDILLSTTAKVFVLEINPFGDLLLDIVNSNNNTTYEQELESLIN